MRSAAHSKTWNDGQSRLSFSLSKGTRADDDARIDTSPLQLTILASILVLADEVIDERCHLLHLLTAGLGIVFL